MMPGQQQRDAWESERAGLNREISELTQTVNNLEKQLVDDRNAWARQKDRIERVYQNQISTLDTTNQELRGKMRLLEERILNGGDDAAELNRKQNKLLEKERDQKRKEASLKKKQEVHEKQVKAFKKTTQAVRSFAFFGRDTPCLYC